MGFTAVAANASNVFNNARVIKASGNSVVLTGSTTRTNLSGDIIIPGGALGPNGVLRICPLFSMTNNANSKTTIITFGNIDFFLSPSTVISSVQTLVQIRNANSLTAQKAYSSNAPAGFGNTANVQTNASVNTAIDQVLKIQATLTNAADTITLEGYTVEYIYGA